MSAPSDREQASQGQLPLALRWIEQGVAMIGRASGLLVLALIAVIVFDVLTRGTSWTNSTKLQELEWHLQTALVFLSLGYALVKNRHVRIEIFRTGWSPQTQARVEIAGILFLLIPVCAVTLWYSWDFVSYAYRTGESSPSMTGLSHRWIIKSTMPLGVALVLLAGLCALVRAISILKKAR